MTLITKEPNKLVHEKSPYLLQHAYNPVDWYPWRNEAFEKAKSADLPIFLSIGYSTCHWCHVMERESFEDEEVARILNEHFVSIKVDREERPDIDMIYMNVCQAMTGQGGWPLTVIITPEKKPFFAGTYFPKRAKYGQPGLLDILDHVAGRWESDRQSLLAFGDKVTGAMQVRLPDKEGKLSEVLLDRAYRQLSRNFDSRYGGFGQAPKFPTPHTLMLLLRQYRRTGDQHTLAMVEKTLTAMYQGGIFDHIGFGFSRYSTDRQWLVPHFEKMLYDNALLAIVYLEAYQITGRDCYAQVARSVFTYLLRDMTSTEGGFYSAEDADSEGVEGKFYVWTPDEVIKLLGQEDGKLFCDYYDISDRGNFEGNSVPNLIDREPEKFLSSHNLSQAELTERLATGRDKLFKYRGQRIHPHKDDKILTAWNGLMIAALAKGAQVLQEPAYLKAARRAVDFIEQKLFDRSGRLLARYRDGEAAFPAYLDDYAFLIWGLLELYQACFELAYLQKAINLAEQVEQLFWDSRQGGFFFNGRDSEELITRPKELYDGALPSGNSVMAVNLIRLSRLTEDERFKTLSEKMLDIFAGEAGTHPGGYTFFLMAVYLATRPPVEVVLLGQRTDDNLQEMLMAVQKKFLPEATIVFSDINNLPAERTVLPLLQEREVINGQATAYICKNYTCSQPVTSKEEMLSVLKI